MIPQLAAVQEDPRIEGLLVLLNTVGGDVEAGLALAELIASVSKPSATLVLGGGHSIGIPLAVSAQRSFIVPTATMTVHPVRHSGVILGVPQTMRWFEQMQQRITGFVAAHSGMTEKRYTELMLHTGELVMDMGTVLDGRRAVKEKLIDELGGLSDALAWLHREIEPENNTTIGLPFAPGAWYNNKIKNCVYANCGEWRRMATKKRKTTTRRSTSRKKRAEQRLPAGLGTLFAGLLLVGLPLWKATRCGKRCIRCCLACLAAAVLCWVQRCAAWPCCTRGARICCPTSASWRWGWCLQAAR